MQSLQLEVLHIALKPAVAASRLQSEKLLLILQQLAIFVITYSLSEDNTIMLLLIDYKVFMRKSIVKIKQKADRAFNTLYGNRNYQKFVIITRSRTGSNLLVSLLNSHPNIYSAGEAFSRIGNNSSKKVWDNVFSPKLSNIKNVGFKIFYYHPLDSEDKSVWQFLEEDKDIKVIHLRRDNMLQTVVSRKIAKQTDIWSNANGKKIPLSEKQIHLTSEECTTEFNKIEEYEQSTRERFKDHPFIEITYEDLTNNNEKTMNLIFSFLKLQNAVVNSKLKKQNAESLSELIINYHQLQDEFTHTRYAAFFE